jgi:predicted O-methyltransferase YrrM
MDPVTQGANLMAAGRFAEAAAILETVRDRSHVAAALLGGIRQSEGRFADAEALYRHALALQPNDAMARDGLDGLRKGLFFPWGKGLFWPTRHVFMSGAVSLMRDIDRPLNILEIGSFAGASALTWARACDHFLRHGARLTCIDLWHQRTAPFPGEATFGFFSSGLMYRAFLSNIATAPRSVRIDHRMGHSDALLPTLPPDSFDLIYVDGSHYYADATNDIRNAKRLLRAGGLLCGDDLELQLHECDAAHAAANRDGDYIVDPKMQTSFHVGVTLAVAEQFGRVENHDGFWIMRKSDDGEYRSVSLRGATAILPLHWPTAIVEQLAQRFQPGPEGEIAL